MASGGGGAPRRRWWHRGPLGRHEVRFSVGTVLAFLFVFYVALPLAASHRAEVGSLAHIHPAYLVLGVLLEIAALVAYAQLTHAVLPHGGPRRLRLFRINLSTLSLSHVAPGGTAPAAALGYRLLTQSGVTGTDAGFALGTQGIGSAVVLNVLFWLSFVGVLVTHGFHVPVGHHGGASAYGSILIVAAAAVGAVLLVVLGGLAWLLARGPERARQVVRRIGERLPFVEADRLVGFLEGHARRFRDLMGDRSLTRRAVGWAAANWLLDAASLWVFVAAFGHVVSPLDLLCAYGLANILAAIPLTPAGLGVVELVLVSTITGFGPTTGEAVSAVLAYRAVNFWLPIPCGGLAYASLELEHRDILSRLRAWRWRSAPRKATTTGPVVSAASTVPFRVSLSQHEAPASAAPVAADGGFSLVSAAPRTAAASGTAPSSAGERWDPASDPSHSTHSAHPTHPNHATHLSHPSRPGFGQVPATSPASPPGRSLAGAIRGRARRGGPGG
jgi:putative heme transporter